MWEHRAVSHNQFKESGRITPTETYVQLMDKVEDAVKEAQKMPFDHEEFLKYIPTQGPWEPIHETDDTKGRPSYTIHWTWPAKVVEYESHSWVNLD